MQKIEIKRIYEIVEKLEYVALIFIFIAVCLLFSITICWVIQG